MQLLITAVRQQFNALALDWQALFSFSSHKM